MKEWLKRQLDFDLSPTLRLIFLFNIFDALLTLCWIAYGIAEEANPIMAYMLSFGVIPFLVSKILLVGISLLILWKLRHMIFARIISMLALVIMTAVLGYHVVGIHMVASY